ncbi:SoxR reducing system RseC family protein [Alistipes ihumii]|uniref:SoxR reducing system RseC family protein n=1 Tax=Alistipes ihumii TaxID=1470347 RepID=UPI00265AA919|nr:SoxR reducing system RseC family protein [Alistipes ihumii]
MSGVITHRGVVTEIFPDAIQVTIRSESACGGCRVRKQCAMGESEDKTLAIPSAQASYFEKGETVEVVTEQAMGIKAVVWAYVLPFLSVMIALLVLLQAGAGELVSGLTSLGILASYYCVLYLLRHRLEKEITFKVRKTS